MGKTITYDYDLFISYAADDADWVEAYFIPALGLPSERIITREDFRDDADKVVEFERAVVKSRYTVLVLSPAFLADLWGIYSESIVSFVRVKSEHDRLITILRQPCEIPLRLKQLSTFDCTNDKNWQRKIDRLREVLNQPEPPCRPIPCPYPGMRPFTESESHYFFGREREVQELRERLASHPLVTIIGPSSSGKSSLVFAGLVPALEQGTFSDHHQEWSIYTMRPGETPLSELYRIFEHDGPPPKKTLATTIAEQAGTRHVLLVIDQFEELFTLAQAEALPFQETLQELITTSTCQIVITVRADFYQDLMMSLLWMHIQPCRQEIIPLKTEGLRDAILKPAEQVGVFVETALVERLVADAANEPGVLPLIQETLALLWEGLERRFLPLYAYEALSAYGGEEQTGLQVAIARHADTVLAELGDEHHMIARRIFLRLIQFGEGRPDTRRQQSVKTLRSTNDNWETFDQTLEHFTRHRLVTQTAQEHDEGSRVDIAHDALIDGWPILQQWIKERRKAEQLRRILETKASEWERLQRKGGLLDEIEVREAKEWLASPEANVLGYSCTLSELVNVSQETIEAKKSRRSLLGVVREVVKTINNEYKLKQQTQLLSEAQARIADLSAQNDYKLKQQTQLLSEAQARIADLSAQIERYRETATTGGNISKPQVLFCYAREDGNVVDEFYQQLSELGLDPWMDRKNLRFGMRWKAIIKKAIQSSDVVLVFLSANSVKKRGFFQKELTDVLEKSEEMLDEDNYLIPIRLDDCKVPEKLRDYHGVDWFAEGKKDIKRLVEDILKGLKRREQ